MHSRFVGMLQREMEADEQTEAPRVSPRPAAQHYA
jgi:hypothetical protein